MNSFDNRETLHQELKLCPGRTLQQFKTLSELCELINCCERMILAEIHMSIILTLHLLNPIRLHVRACHCCFRSSSPLLIHCSKSAEQPLTATILQTKPINHYSTVSTFEFEMRRRSLGMFACRSTLFRSENLRSHATMCCNCLVSIPVQCHDIVRIRHCTTANVDVSQSYSERMLLWVRP